MEIFIPKFTEKARRNKSIVLRPVSAPPRADWEAAFAAAIAQDDAPEGDMVDGLANQFDHPEW